MNELVEATNGTKTTTVAFLQAVAVLAAQFGFIQPETLTAASQVFGGLFTLTLGHKVYRAAKGQ